MHAASAAAARGLRRRSLVTVFAAVAAVSLMGGPRGVLPVWADEPTQAKPPVEVAPVDQVDPSSISAAEQRIENVIAAARQYVGVPYRVGSEGPWLFDCSGLVFRAFSDAALLDRIGGARLRAAGYMRWFAGRGLMTANEAEAQRGDLVIYDNGAHIGLYLGDGRAVSALLSGVTVHSLHGISLPVTGFLRPDWSGDGKVAPFVPMTLPEVAEVAATLVPAAEWMPTLDESTVAPIDRVGTERVDLRTTNSRTFANRDGTFTTEFHAQPIYYQAPDSTELQPIDLRFQADDKGKTASVTASPTQLTTRAVDDEAGFLAVSSADRTLTFGLADKAGMRSSKAMPQVIDEGRVVDYFDFQPKGVGLRVLARPDGFKSFIVLSREPELNRFSFTLDATGLTPVANDDGSITLVDEAGAVIGRIPRPFVLDSSDADGNGGGVYTSAATLSVTSEDETTVISVTVDRGHLDEAVYPAFVDFSLVDFPQPAGTANLSFASSTHPNVSFAGYQRPETPGFGELWLGHQPNSRYDNEVFVRFNDLAATLGTVDVASASLELLPYWQRADEAVTTARRVAADWDPQTLTWTTRPETDIDLGTLTSAAGQWSTLDVSTYVTDVLSHGTADFGLVLAGDENGTGTWKRLVAGDDGDAAEYGPRLVVTWSGLRPNALTVVDGTLGWSQPQIAPDQARFQVQLSRNGFETIAAESGTIKGKPGKQAAWTLADGTLSDPGIYQWRVRVRYAVDKTWSSWSAPQTLAWGAIRTEDVAPNTTSLTPGA